MNEPKLHKFDHAMCDHVVEVTRMVAAANPRFERMIRSCFSEWAGDDLKPGLLLSEWELLLVEGAAAFARFSDLWVPDVFAYDRWVDATTEIRRGLGDKYVAAWEDYSEAAVDRLHSGERFDVGMEVIREWLGEARKLLRAMERLDLVPRPSGGHPTWTRQEPGPSVEEVEESDGGSCALADETERTADVLLLDINQVASLLKTSVRNVYRMRDDGRMPQPLKLRGSNRWSRQKIEQWVADGCPSCAPVRQRR